VHPSAVLLSIFIIFIISSNFTPFIHHSRCHLQVHFQHTELVQKRTKLDAQKDVMAKEATQRQSSISNLQDTVQTRRERLHELHNKGGRMHSKPPPGIFKLMLEVEYIQGRWMKILGKRTAALETATSALNVKMEQKERIRKQYDKILMPPPQPKKAALDYETDDDASVGAALAGGA